MPISRIRFIAALAAFCFAAIIFLVVMWVVVQPNEFDRRVEWVQLKVAALLPQPPHPEFVPTPLAVDIVPTLEPTQTTAATGAPAALPSATPTTRPTAAPTRTATRPNPSFTNLPPRVALTNFRHDYQRFNNCGPATLAIFLSHFGRSETQYDLAPILKGNKDDRNVNPEEIAALVQTYGFHSLIRVNGTQDEMKAFLVQGMPIMIENWFVPKPADASGHYRLLTGYDDTASASTRGAGLSVEWGGNYPATETGYFIAQDSYTGPDTKLPYRAWDLDWRVFNRTYLVLYSDAQAATVRAIVGDNMDDAAMYTRASQVAQREVDQNNADAYGWFNLGSSLVGLGKYADAARAFDKARYLKLPWRMMWYQFGPYEAYYHTGRYDEVISLADSTLAPSPGLEESLYYRGLAQIALGKKDAARTSFQLALQSNSHYTLAKQALDGMTP